jgi:cytochrome c oxidase assembly factor CtaG
MLLGPPVLAVIVAAALYALGGRGGPVGGRERAERRWRTALFAAGLATILLAVSPPMDRLSDSLFWVHMLQHVLLIEIAAPLIVLSRPWNRLWRPFPLTARRTVARGVARGGWAAPVRWVGRVLAIPAAAFVVMNVALVAWHVPALYDAALANPLVHGLEHAAFFATALHFWAHLLGDGPFRARLTLPGRAAYAIGAMLVGWGLAVAIATAPSPLYTHYADLASRPLGLSALADQQLAAGVMWVPASVPWFSMAILCVYGWLDSGARRRGIARALGGETLTTTEVQP